MFQVVFAPTCGNALALEHNGDVYACDHIVERKFKLGNIKETSMVELVGSEQQRQFGQDKHDTLLRYCRQCEVRFACNGGCPKDRFLNTPDGESGLNYLCAGYKMIFTHVARPMRMMAGLLRHGRYADEVMSILAADEATRLQQAFVASGRNDPCSCGSGRKFQRCHDQSGVQRKGQASTH